MHAKAGSIVARRPVQALLLRRAQNHSVTGDGLLHRRYARCHSTSSESRCTHSSSNNSSSLVQELMCGKGYSVLPGLVSADDVQKAKSIIVEHSESHSDKVTHFQGGQESRRLLQRRVWNLLNKGEVFERIVQLPRLMEAVGAFLGDQFCMGSVAANRILPGGPGQEPHIDYPYWDMHKPSSFPNNINASFPLNCQVTILLDEFTPQNGATAILPGSQVWCRYPQEGEEKMFFDKCERMVGKAGDGVIFFGLAWHCAMPNHSSRDRTGVLIQYLPKFVKPMEDQRAGVSQRVLERATPELKQLMGLTYPYPQVLDEAAAGNTEGRQL
ncbi:uncharacterized protein Mb3657-like [Sycon ciliatum]|uniref:uncharacterized protein Mb3657-like n=1 Tax=Sycon ciliatum TaxID=27933 RepID=UPI0031F6C010